MPIVTTARQSDLLGRQPWIESASGFPAGSWCARGDGRPDPESVIASTPSGDFTGRQAGNVVAFTEFLAGAAFDTAEREWLIDCMAREFETEPAQAAAELHTIASAVDTVSFLEPVERADSRQKALTSSYRLDVHRQRAGLAENPIMTMIRAHNPAILVDRSGVVVTADAVEARDRINRIILAIANRHPAEQRHLRTDMARDIDRVSTPLKAELAGSIIRLVILRIWLAGLEPTEFDRLRVRAAEVVDTSTDLGLVGLMLSYRAMIEAMTDIDDGD